MKRLLLAAVFVLVASSANAQLPSTLNHVDPKAPCFRWPASDMDGDGVFDRLDHCPDTPKGCLVDPYGCSLDADGDGVCDGIDQCPDTPRGVKVDKYGCSVEQRAAMGRTAPAPAPVTPPRAEPTPPPSTPPPSRAEQELVEKGVIRLENVYFETNSAKLLPESAATLDEVGAAIAKHPELRIEVQGHTDTRGSGPYNLKLSNARAESVLLYLVDHFHLKPDMLTAKGYGKTRPLTKERNDEERLRNRRVELHVLNPEALPKNVEIKH